jgi:hypothetical protein
MKTVVIFLVSILTLSACSIEKRIHTKGWNVQWNKPYKLKTEDISSTPSFRPTSDLTIENTKVDKFKVDTTITLVSTIAIELEDEGTLLRAKSEKATILKKISTKFDSPTKPSNLESIEKSDSLIIKNRYSPSSQRDINWELLGTIGAILLLLLIIGIAWFGSGTLALIASIILAIGGLILTIAAFVCILWFFWLIFFSWAS